MSALEIIDQIKHLTVLERAQVVRFIVQNESLPAPAQFTVSVALDGLPVIRANPGVITSRLVNEIESLTP